MTETSYLSQCPLWKWILLTAGGMALFFLVYALTANIDYYTENTWIASGLYIVGALIILAVYSAFVELTEHRDIHELIINRAHIDTSIGFLVGALFMSTIAAILFCYGYYTPSINEFLYSDIFWCLCFYLLISVGEEIMFRGILHRMIADRFGVPAALIVSSLLFGFAHITNDNATVLSSVFIAVEAGLLLGAAYEFSRNLWLPIGIHWAWNFTQGNIYGFNVSGNCDEVSVLSPEITGPDIMTGGEFGLEASVITTIIGLGLSVLLLYVKKKD